MENIKILWVDDEIDFLKPYIIFLEDKGFDVKTASNGHLALTLIDENYFDIVFLDEQMPGLNGLMVLSEIKAKKPHLPVVMITKSEEENIMEEAIGSKISDYLIKPVKPNQLLLCIKKNIDNKKLINEKTTSDYQKEFRKISMKLNDYLTFEEWKELYKNLVHWDIELQKSDNKEMLNILQMQKEEANIVFAKYIEKNYISWINNNEKAPLSSNKILKEKIIPSLNNDGPLFFIVIDNLRFDQWKILQDELNQYFKIIEEDLYLSILPTSTQFSRNAIFSGMMPENIKKTYPNKWVNENDKEGKNEHEEFFINSYLNKYKKDIKISYNKITNLSAGKALVNNFSNLSNYDLNVIVYNFVDMLSHARTEMEVLKELAEDEAAYLSLTLSWFKHSPLIDVFKLISEKNYNIVLTTDHGSIRVKNPIKIIGDSNTNTNLRYKSGKNLSYNSKNIITFKNPKEIMLPQDNISTSYVFSSGDNFFAYPNNFNYYVQYYKNTFQHGGVSLEEMLLPIIKLRKN